MYHLVIDLSSFELCVEDRFFQEVHIEKCYPVGIGKESTPTPTGDTKIDKLVKNAQWLDPWGVNHGSGFLGTWTIVTDIENSQRVIAIHGTKHRYSIGGAYSGGCIRMYDEDVIDLVNRYIFYVTGITIKE